MNNTFESVATERQQIEKFLGHNFGQLPVPVSIALFSNSGVKINKPSRDGKLLIADLKRTTTALRTITPAMSGEGAIERFPLSLKALGQLLAYEKTQPGRKLLLWIGPGWPLLSEIQFGATASDKHADWDGIISFSTDLREARVSLYSVDAMSSQSNLPRDFFYRNFLKPVTAPKDADSANLSLSVMAIQSGGRVLNGSNDLDAKIAS